MDPDDALRDQVDYYRRRAPEYDETAVDDIESASRRFGLLLQQLDPTGDVLEIACGTGLWTQHLVRATRTLTALDSSPEMIELARARIDDAAVTFIVAEVFSWHPPQRYDSVFFGFWLSHVPPQRFASFWELLDRCLRPSGRALFVDEGAPRAAAEPAAASSAVVQRQLRDGTMHNLVKVFHDPARLRDRLEGIGWEADIDLTGEGLLVGSVRRAELTA